MALARHVSKRWPIAPVVSVTSDEALARDQVIDCAVAWAARPTAANTRDLRLAIEILAHADHSAPPQPAPPPSDSYSYQQQVRADYYWGR